MNFIGPIFTAIAEFFKWRAEETRLKVIRVRLDEMVRLDKENEEDEKRILELRASKRDTDADVLLHRQTIRARLRAEYAASLSVPGGK